MAISPTEATATPTTAAGDVMSGRRTVMAMGSNMRHVRHAEILARWPILPEGWAKAVETTRLSAVDRTPGTATFGR
ncbi:MAG: hypothetical protein AB7V62_05040 [Thermoleophilia bacterium]